MSSETPSIPSVFLVGASGYIGGQILFELINQYPDSPITVQYRAGSEKYVEKFKAFSKNIQAIQASFDDADILREQASKHDVVITAADCDDMKSNKAIVEGLESAAHDRVQNKKPKAVLIHTSGTGELIDPSIPQGELDPTVYDDGNTDQIEGMPADRAHRDVSLMVCEAIGRGAFLGYIVLPSTIYGRGQGPIHTISQQIPGQTRFALKNARAIYVAAGKNIWSSVHVRDLGRLYVSLLTLLLSPANPPPPHRPQSHYIFACNDETFCWGDITKRIGDVLKQMGEIEQGGAEGKPASEVKEALAGGTTAGGLVSVLTGTTSVGKSSNAKRLVRWTQKEKSIEEQLAEDVRDVVEEWKSQK